MNVLESLKQLFQKEKEPKRILRELDRAKMRGVVSMGYGKHYEPKVDIFGNTRMIPVLEDVQWVKENLIIIPGTQYTLCKLFNLPITVTGGNIITPISNVTPGFLNDVNQMNFDRKESPPMDLVGVNINPMHFVSGFMIGYGGATQSNIVARDVNYKSRMLYSPVPFRYTTADLNSATRTRYGGIVTSPDLSGGLPLKSYYIKKFDNPVPQIYHLWKDNGLQDGTPATNSIFDTVEDNGMDVESYIEMELSVEPLEVREYFQSVLSGEPPRFNELGLIAGYWDPTTMDVLQAQLFSHICFPTEPLHGTGGSIGPKSCFILYRIYLK